MLISKDIDAVIIAIADKKTAAKIPALGNLLCKNGRFFTSDGACAYSMPSPNFEDADFPGADKAALPVLPQDWEGLIPGDLILKAIKNRQQKPSMPILEHIQAHGNTFRISLTTAESQGTFTSVTQPAMDGMYPPIEDIMDEPAQDGDLQVTLSLANLDKLVKIMRKLKQEQCTLNVPKGKGAVHVSFPESDITGAMMPCSSHYYIAGGNKMTLTLKECYSAMSKMWWQLADNPKLRKPDIPEATKYPTGCPACAYVLQKEGDMGACCRICPMQSLWPDGCSILPTPYTKWEKSKGYDRQFFAAVIAEEAELLLKKEVTK